MCITRNKKDQDRLASPGTHVFFEDRVDWVTSLLGNACGGTGGVGDPHLVLSVIFSRTKPKFPC